MIIGIAGRLNSGKTELSKICEKYGFKRLYFALPLKQLIASLIDKTVEDVNNLKAVDAEYVLSDDKIHYLANEIDSDYDTIKPLVENKIFHNTRELLQYIGTDIIRKLNSDWHVNKIKNMIRIEENYVIDDVRFENEKRMIETKNGFLFFVIRPYLKHISNHESESTLKWQNFDNLIINDGNLGQLKFKWETFVKNGIADSIMYRASLLNKIHTDENLCQTFINSSNEELNMFNMMFINKCELAYNPKYTVNKNDIERIENFNDSIFRVYYKNKEVEVVTNPLEIEDLKFYYNNE